MRPTDRSLLAIFETEQKEIVERIRTLIEPDAAGAAAQPAAIEELLRRTHTLKGAARAVGLGPTERLAHCLEALFVRVRDGGLALAGPVLSAVHEGLEAAEDVLASAVGGRPEPDISQVLGLLERLRAGPGAAMAGPAAGQEIRPSSAVAEPPLETVRVSARRIDELVRSASQLLASAAESGTLGELHGLAERVSQARREYGRLRRQAAAALRARSADPEVARVFECLDYVEAQLGSLAAGNRSALLAARRRAWTLHQLAANLHQDACAVRMTPAETVFGVFRRMVRELAADEGKEVEFRLEGAQVEADRLVLQRLKDPVMHLLRNAVSHGIEAPGQRAAAGKPRSGSIWLRLETRGDRLRVTVQDDGRGIDLAKVAEVAVNRGLADRGVVARPQELVHLLLEPGFSTSEAVTELAGRGIGLSVVQQEVARLQGELRIDPGPAGVSVALSVPLSISTHHVLLVGCGRHTFAIPSAAIERLYRVRPADIQAADGGAAIRIDSRPLPLARLAAVLGLPEGATDEPALPIVVLRSGENRVGLIVDRLIDERHAVVKDSGLPAASAGMTTGGVPLENGEVAVVLNPLLLLERWRTAERTAPPPPAPAGRSEPASILVVDDSLTTRSLEKSILEAHGYRVRVAVDGTEALAALRAEPADLVIADVIMPGLDGFQLLEQIKKDKRLARIPVIIVTSLESREDQERGLALGADGYIVKRKFDQAELLDTVRQIL